MSDDAQQRSDYRWFLPITTRWMDNDVYGHVNNVHYYSWFDTIANSFLIEQGGLDIKNGATIGYIVHSQCSYKSAIAFPEAIEGGFRVNKLGRSSVEYGIAIFKQGQQHASAFGSYTHVFVAR
jgi:acyl-CoA thioester hydrolase